MTIAALGIDLAKSISGLRRGWARIGRAAQTWLLCFGADLL